MPPVDPPASPGTTSPGRPWATALLWTLVVYAVLALALALALRTPFPRLIAGPEPWAKLPAAVRGFVIALFVGVPAAVLSWVAAAGIRRRPRPLCRQRFRQGAALLAAMALVVAALPIRTSPLAAGTATGSIDLSPIQPPEPRRDLEPRIDAALRAIEDGERDARRDRWDPGYIVERVGTDPGRLFAWVSDNTGWIPYRGELRGPVGVLMDRVGSSLDRSLLLATLLQQAGHSVRLVHGELTREQAASIFPGLLGARIAIMAADAVGIRGSAPDLSQVAKQYRLDETGVTARVKEEVHRGNSVRADLARRVSDQVQRLRGATASLIATEGTGRNAADVLEVLRDHWWVQRSTGSGWTDMDLVSGDTGRPLTAASGEPVMPDRITEGERHTVVIRVTAEQWTRDGLVEHTALEHVLVPAELAGTLVSVRLWPTDWPQDVPRRDSDPRQAMREAALAQHRWLPVLQVGREVISQAPILDTGDVGETSRASEAARELREARDRALGRIPAAKPQTSLDAIWIDYEIRVPGEQPRKIRRTVFDLLGARARSQKPVPQPRLDEPGRLARSVGLMTQTDILLQSSKISPAFARHLGAQSLLAGRHALMAVVRAEVPSDRAGAQKLAGEIPVVPLMLYRLAVARFDGNRLADRVFLDRPNILARHVFLAPSAGGGVALHEATDIVANDIGVAPLADSFAVRLEQGVFDTNAEALLYPATRDPVSNTSEAFLREARWVALDSPADARVTQLRLPEDVKADISADLTAGNVVVAPAAPVPLGSDSFTGWWRIDRASGMTLGIGRNGWGQSAAQYSAVLLVLEGAALDFLFAYMYCNQMLEARESVDMVASATPCECGGSRSIVDYVIAPVHAVARAGSQPGQPAKVNEGNKIIADDLRKAWEWMNATCYRQAVTWPLLALVWGGMRAVFLPGGAGMGGGLGANAGQRFGEEPGAAAGAGGAPGRGPGGGGKAPGSGPGNNPSRGPAEPRGSGAGSGSGPGGPGKGPLGPVKSDPYGRQMINANPTSDATIKMYLDAGQPQSLDHLNQMLDGADQAAQVAYDNARGLGLGDQAAHDISGKAWNRFLRENTAALGREPTGSGLGTDSTQPGPGGAGGLGPTGTQVMNPPNAPPCPAPPCGPSQSPNAKTGAGFSQLADTLPQIKR